MNKRVRVRFAPSPTGGLHLGGVRTVLFNYLFAKKHGGDFILRIEDTDQSRFVPGAEEYIIQTLNWCGMTPDESPVVGGPYAPYRQSERKENYKQYATQLIEAGHAYYAFDTPAEIEEMRNHFKTPENPSPQYNHAVRAKMRNSLSLDAAEVAALLEAGTPYVVRIKMPDHEEVTFTDMIRGEVSFNTSQVDDKVLLKADGMPTYHLAVVVDDYLMKISHAFRGEEWLPSAPVHILLWKYLGWQNEMPEWAHLPLILKPDGHGKLSKRDGDRLGFPVFPLNWTDPKTGEFSSGYKEAGYFPDAFLNLLAFLGWNPGTEQEIFSIEEMTQAFSLDKVSKSGAKFSLDKARWFNQQYLQKKSAKEILSAIELPANNLSESQLEKVVELLKPRCVFAKDILTVGSFFFAAPTKYDEKTVEKKWKENSPQIVKDLHDIFAQESDFSAANLEAKFKAYLEQKQLGFGAAMPPLRLMITGFGEGPSLFDVMEVLGKEESLARMNKTIS